MLPKSALGISLTLLISGGLILTIGDIILKRWVDTNAKTFFIAGLAMYLVGETLLAFSFKYQNIAVASAIMIIVNIIALAIVSWLYFKETLNAVQLVGIVLGLLAVVMLELGSRYHA